MSREYPKTPRVAVGVVVLHADQVLLIKRGKAPEAGRWSLPGGGQELGETIAAAAIREVREETHVEIALGDVITVVDSIKFDAHRRPRFHYTIVDFAARWVSGTAIAGSDVVDARWVPIAELDAYNLWDKTLDVIGQAPGFLPE